MASVDAVLCRWGYMLMADPAAALRETRRVLRPGGRVALAVWDAIEHNPWAPLPGAELRERGLDAAAGAAARPGRSRSAAPSACASCSRQAGFAEVEVEALELQRRHASFEEFWETTLDLSRGFHDAVLARPQAEIEEIQARRARALRAVRRAPTARSRSRRARSSPRASA